MAEARSAAKKSVTIEADHLARLAQGDRVNETSEQKTLEQVPRDELRLLIESQAEVVELIATNAT